MILIEIDCELCIESRLREVGQALATRADRRSFTSRLQSCNHLTSSSCLASSVTLHFSSHPPCNAIALYGAASAMHGMRTIQPRPYDAPSHPPPIEDRIYANTAITQVKAKAFPSLKPTMSFQMSQRPRIEPSKYNMAILS